jgi:hypothetical protein
VLQGVVPGLRAPAELVGHKPGTVGRRRALAVKELVTLVQPIQRVNSAVVCWELELVELCLRIITERWLATLVAIVGGTEWWLAAIVECATTIV